MDATDLNALLKTLRSSSKPSKGPLGERSAWDATLHREAADAIAGLVSRTAELEAARKPDLVPGLERAREIVRMTVWPFSHFEGAQAVGDTIAAELAELRSSPSPEDPPDEHAPVGRLDGLPQPQ